MRSCACDCLTKTLKRVCPFLCPTGWSRRRWHGPWLRTSQSGQILRVNTVMQTLAKKMMNMSEMNRFYFYISFSSNKWHCLEGPLGNFRRSLKADLWSIKLPFFQEAEFLLDLLHCSASVFTVCGLRYTGSEEGSFTVTMCGITLPVGSGCIWVISSRGEQMQSVPLLWEVEESAQSGITLKLNSSMPGASLGNSVRCEPLSQDVWKFMSYNTQRYKEISYFEV